MDGDKFAVVVDAVQDIVVIVAGVVEYKVVVVGAFSFIINVAVRTPTPVAMVIQIPPMRISFNKVDFDKAGKTAPCLQENLLARYAMMDPKHAPIARNIGLL